MKDDIDLAAQNYVELLKLLPSCGLMSVAPAGCLQRLAKHLLSWSAAVNSILQVTSQLRLLLHMLI